MKLLLDENLSRRLVPFLQDAFPGTTQVALIGLEQTSDRTLWNYAKDNDYVIVTQDADFQELSLLLGHPPRVIWLKLRTDARCRAQSTHRQSRADRRNLRRPRNRMYRSRKVIPNVILDQACIEFNSMLTLLAALTMNTNNRLSIEGGQPNRI